MLIKRLKTEDYTKWRRRDLWTLQQALFLLLGAEPSDSWFDPDIAAYSLNYRSDHEKALVRSYKEYFELAEDAIRLRKLKPFEIHEYQEPIHNMRFRPQQILEWARIKQLDIPEPLEPILKEVSTDRPVSTSAESRRVERREATRQRNERLQQEANKLAQAHPTWTKDQIAYELSKRSEYRRLKAETIKRNIRIIRT
jgi:chromosome condensin MukBEF ATPase and DNA-binding subunit MukB